MAPRKKRTWPARGKRNFILPRYAGGSSKVHNLPGKHTPDGVFLRRRPAGLPLPSKELRLAPGPSLTMLGPTTIAHSLREFLQRSEDRPIPLQTLVQAANHTDPYEVAGVVADFVKDGLLEQYVVVVSPSGNGPLGEYPSILNVPERLPDPYTGQDFRVTLESLQIFYRLPRR